MADVSKVFAQQGYLGPMPEAVQKQYPGGVATPQQILGLAEEYRKAANILLPTGSRGRPMSRAPYRLSAIQAIELYLNALLLERGHAADLLRGLQHNLAARTQLAVEAGLNLRQRTALHLQDMTADREYLIARYGPEMTGTVSQLNRLNATLEEVARKVGTMIQKT